MLVSDVMTTPAVTVGPATTIKEALTLLDEHGVTALPVTAGHHRIVGVVSEADLIRIGIQPDLRRHLGYAPPELSTLPPHTVGEVMNMHPVTVSADADLLDAIDLLTTTTIKSLPVVDNDRHVVGVVSRRDVVHALAIPDEALAAAADERLRRLGTDWLVDVMDGVASVQGPVTSREAAVATAALGAVPGITGVTVRTEDRLTGDAE